MAKTQSTRQEVSGVILQKYKRNLDLKIMVKKLRLGRSFPIQKSGNTNTDLVIMEYS